MYLLFIDSHKKCVQFDRIRKNHVIKKLYVSVEQEELGMIGVHSKGVCKKTLQINKNNNTPELYNTPNLMEKKNRRNIQIHLKC